MKKKHLNGRLSLKVKDLSALNGNQENQVVGGNTDPNLDCSYIITGCGTNNATVVATCTIVGNSAIACHVCAPTYQYKTCPPNATCGAATCSPSCTVYPNC